MLLDSIYPILPTAPIQHHGFPPIWRPEVRNPNFHTDDDVIRPVRT
jgi:hypothetical protein